jgi:outer membrane protein assembly factor BamB
MRLVIGLIAFTLASFGAYVAWVFLVQAPAFRDTIRHVASTRPVHLAVERTARAAEDVPLARDLSHRPGADWPGFLGPSGDGRSPEEGVRLWPAEGPRVVWAIEAGEGYAAPAVCRGRVLFFDRVKSLVRCRCLSAQTGAELWRFTYATDYLDRQGYDGGPRACPVTDGHRVYLHGPEGMLHCLRLDDGQLLWKIHVLATFGVVQNLFGAASAPLLDGDRVILQVGGSPEGSSDRNFMTLESNGSAIVAFAKQSGAVLYQCGHELASYSSPRIVVIDGKRTGLAFARGGLLGFDPDRGVESFKYAFRARSYNAVNASNPVVDGRTIFLTESYEVGCVLLEASGDQLTKLWSATPRQRDAGVCCHWNTPILVNGHLYGCASRHRGDAELRCVELATGRVKWVHRPALDGDAAGRSSLAYADGQLFYFTEEGWLFLLRANSERYEPLATWNGKWGSSGQELHYPCWAGPVLSRGQLFLRGKGRLICLEVIPEGD